MQQRRDEILAKKAKLAELKRQRELRQSQGGGRPSISGSDVRQPNSLLFGALITSCGLELTG